MSLYDVIAVNIKTGSRRIIATGKTESNAVAIVNMAAARRGVDVEFYQTVPAGSVRLDTTDDARGE